MKLTEAAEDNVGSEKEEPKTPYVGNIEKQTLANENFREVIFTGKHAQLVLMTLQKGEEIGNEVHENVDQFFRIEQGKAKFVFNEKDEHVVANGGAALVPAGTYHNVINVGKEELKLYTVYSPPNHPPDTIHKTKADAEKAEKEEHEGNEEPDEDTEEAEREPRERRPAF